MCTNKNYAWLIKKEYDAKFHVTGKRSKPIFVGSVKKVNDGDLDLFQKLSLSEAKSGKYELVKLSCGQCKECRLRKIKEVALQSTCEAQYWDEHGNGNSFITLTFGDEATYNYLRKTRKMSRYKAKKYTDFLCWSLESREFQLFMKRLRKEVAKYYPSMFENLERNLRVLHCGEYGDINQRPHHHAIIFNFNFPDAYLYKIDKKTGEKYYRSPLLERCWPFGISLLSGTSYNTCRYVSGYVMKKINGKKQYEYYCGRKPEFRTSSNRPGLGFDWFMKYGATDVLPQDSLQMHNWKGKKIIGKPPKYFDKLVADINPEYLEIIKEKRKIEMSESVNTDTQIQWISREIISNEKYNKLSHDTIFQNDFDSLKDEYYRKGGAFGISKSVLDKKSDETKKYLKLKSYKDYEIKNPHTKVIAKCKKFFKDLNASQEFIEMLYPRKKRSELPPPRVDTIADELDWIYSHIEGFSEPSAP